MLNSSALTLLLQSNPVISRAVNSRKSVSRACTLDPKFWWRATRHCPYDRPVTHMGWCEQISPLAHSSQATWQPFYLSHCIEMHNTHLLGRTGQLSQAYFTHSAPILTPRNLPLTVNKQWPPLRESRMSRHTRFNTSRKTVDTTIGPNPILYFYCVENVEILVRFANLSPRSSSNFGETRPRRAGRACVKPFLFPVKSRRSLADFN